MSPNKSGTDVRSTGEYLDSGLDGDVDEMQDLGTTELRTLLKKLGATRHNELWQLPVKPKNKDAEASETARKKRGTQGIKQLNVQARVVDHPLLKALAASSVNSEEGISAQFALHALATGLGDERMAAQGQSRPFALLCVLLRQETEAIEAMEAVNSRLRKFHQAHRDLVDGLLNLQTLDSNPSREVVAQVSREDQDFAASGKLGRLGDG